jgi:hypothetical protein
MKSAAPSFFRRAAISGLAALLLLAGGAFPAVAEARPDACKPNGEPGPPVYRCAKEGDLLEVRLSDLHPTQAVLGFREIHYRLGRYEAGKDKVNKRFDDWCKASGLGDAKAADADARLDDPKSFTCELAPGAETEKSVEDMKAVVIGPGGEPYLVDGHHTLNAFFERKDGGADVLVRLKVLANLGALKSEEFWKTMQEKGWVWLRDGNGQPIAPKQLPKRLGLTHFADDPYRGLLYFQRDVSFKQDAANANFQELYWGQWLRRNPRFKLNSYRLDDFKDFIAADEAAGKLIAGLKGGDTVDSGLSARDLGRIDFDTGEFAKVSRSFCEDKPGKIGYAFYYYHNVLRHPPKLACR